MEFRLRAALVAALAALCVVRVLTLGSRPWLDAAIGGLAFVAGIGILNKRLPAQNWCAVIAIMGIIGGIVEWWIGAGMRAAGAAALWIVSLIMARGAAARALCQWRRNPAYGFWLIGIAGFLSALFTSAAMAACMGQESLFGFLTRTGAAWAALVAVAPLLISKRPAPEIPEWESPGCWIALNTVVACVAMHRGDWMAFYAATIGAGIVGLASACNALGMFPWGRPKRIT